MDYFLTPILLCKKEATDNDDAYNDDYYDGDADNNKAMRSSMVEFLQREADNSGQRFSNWGL